jgi:hypothetical protein
MRQSRGKPKERFALFCFIVKQYADEWALVQKDDDHFADDAKAPIWAW